MSGRPGGNGRFDDPAMARRRRRVGWAAALAKVLLLAVLAVLAEASTR